GRGLRIATLWSGRCRRIRADFDLTLQDGPRAARVHYQNYKIGCLSAELESDTPAFERHHRWGAPRTGEVFARAAGHCAAPIVGADDEGRLHDGRIDDYALRLVQ